MLAMPMRTTGPAQAAADSLAATLAVGQQQQMWASGSHVAPVMERNDSKTT
jgi:hypothetical protein